MDKQQIIESIAAGRLVERMVENTAHSALTADLCDLCQMVYLILLEYDEDKLQDLWDNGQIRFFLARIIVNQFRSSTSPYHYLIRVFQERSQEIACVTSRSDDGNHPLSQPKPKK